MNTKEDTHVEATGMSILIFGNAFRGFCTTTLGYFDAFSVGAGEDV